MTITSAFTKTWQSNFGLFKLKATQMKYQDPVGGEIFEFLFKMVVTLLLLKMVIAIIFDAYKEAAIKTRKTSPTVFADFRRLSFHINNAIAGGDGFVPPDLVGKFMRHTLVRYFRNEKGEQVQREILREDEIGPIFKKVRAVLSRAIVCMTYNWIMWLVYAAFYRLLVQQWMQVMKKEFPGITDPQLMVKCEWMLEKYGRITCEQRAGEEVHPKQVAKVHLSKWLYIVSFLTFVCYS